MNYFKLLSRIEGASLLVLLFIAMPAKYQFGISEVVFYAGITHGSLFLAYMAGSLAVSHHQNWSILRWLSVFLAGVIPFGFLVVDKKLQLWHIEESPVPT
jgi:integral membrane protein